MSTLPRKHLTAWLGLVAMWLIVLAPLASQFVAAAQRSDPARGVLCSSAQPNARPALHDMADRFAACGYCDLLIDHAAMPPAHAAPFMLFAIAVVCAIAPLVSRYVPFGAFESGRPRAPPVSP